MDADEVGRGNQKQDMLPEAWTRGLPRKYTKEQRQVPGCMNCWTDNWDCIGPMFKFAQTARQVMYTTNAIESLNSGFR